MLITLLGSMLLKSSKFVISWNLLYSLTYDQILLVLHVCSKRLCSIKLPDEFYCVSLDRVCWMCCWIFCLYWFFYVLEILIWKKFIISLTLMIDLSISSLNSIGFCFIYFKAYLCEVLIILFSWWIVLFTIKMCLSSSLIILELYLIWYWYSDISFLLASIYLVCHFSVLLLIIFLCSCILAVFCTVYTAYFFKRQ